MAKIARESTELVDAQAILDALGPPPEAVVPSAPATVALLLGFSRDEHQQSIRFSQHWTPVMGQPNPDADPDQRRAHLQHAATLRASAQVLDPTHSDPAWADEQNTNYENGPLLQWYREMFVPASTAA